MMKKCLIAGWVAAAMLTGCTLPDDIAQTKQMPRSFIEHEFDSREWAVAYQAQDDDQIIVEWTVNSEPVENWSELITGQVFFVDSQYSAQQFAELMVNQISPNASDFKMNFIKDTPDDVMLEWSHTGSGSWPAQHEVMRVFRGEDGLYRLAYTVKESAFSESRYRHWVDAVQRARLIPR